MRKQTVFLAVRGGFTPRFLLRTDIVPVLRHLGVGVVILSPNAQESYFASEFGRNGLITERLRVEECQHYLESSRVQKILQVLRSQILSSRGDLTTIKQVEAVNADQMRRIGLKGGVVGAMLRAITAVARRSALTRQALVTMESIFFRPSFHADLYQAHRPQLLVVTSLGYADSAFERYLMREARRFGCKVVSVILSWDNTSSKGLRGGPVDYVIAWTETMKRELIQYHDIEPDRIFVCGPPHFDAYYRAPQMSRQELFERFGLDPQRKLLTLATKSPTNYPWNEDLVEMIAKAIAEGRLTEDCQLLIRIHPIYYRRRNGNLVFADVLARTRELQRQYKHVYIDEPEIISTKLPLDMPQAEMEKLAAILRHSSVLVNIYSTLNLEASIVDTPIVNVSFNGYGRVKTSPRCDVALDEVQPHNQRIIQSGGVTVVRGEGELIGAINAYLKDPSLHREGRRRICLQECGPNPGTAGRAIGETIASLMGT
jgi:hypothetical protein